MKTIFIHKPDKFAMGHYRATLPYVYCKSELAKEGIELVLDDRWTKPPIEADAYVFHRVIAPEFRPIYTHLCETKSVALEYDDDLTAVPYWSPAYKRMHPEREAFKLQQQQARYLWVSTDNLANDPKARVLPNLLHAQDQPPEYNHERPRIVWAGSNTHQVDLGLIVPALEQLTKVRDVDIIFFGDYPTYLNARYMYAEPVPHNRYESTLATLEPDIGLCPLFTLPFNRCKSFIKWAEYTLAGAAVIASDLEPYQTVTHNVDGLKVGKGDWLEPMLFLLDDLDARRRLTRAARANIDANHLWNGTGTTGKDAWLNAFRELVA